MGNLSHVNEKLRVLNMGKKSVLDQVRDAISDSGLPLPDTIKIDGKLHRFSTNGKSKDQAGWYVFHNGGIVWGAFGCNRTFGPDCSFSFQQDMGRALTGDEQLAIDRARQRAQEDKDESKEAAEAEALKTWQELGPASPDHPYLLKKCIEAHHLKQQGDALIVPYLDSDLNIKSYQKIYANGKYWQSGNNGKNKFSYIGQPEPFKKAFFVEGFGDAATIYQETGVPVVFCAGTPDMESSAIAAQKSWPETLFTIKADNDASGAGQKAAEKASQATGWPVIMPTEQGQDISDYYLAGGSVKELLIPHEDKPQARGLTDLLADTKPTRWLVKNWIPRESLGMLHGPSAGGKSFVTVDLAMSVAVGKSHWNGSRVRQGRVLCLSGEGQGGFVRRIQAWCQQNEVNSGDLSVYDKQLDLDTPQGLAELVAEIELHTAPPDLIIIDTLHCYYAGDENSSKDARAMIANLKIVIDRFGCSVLVVHHTGLGESAQQRARGSSSWRGALDFELNLKPGGDGEPITVRHMKSKDGSLMPQFYVSIETVPLIGRFDEDGEQEHSAVIAIAEKPKDEESDRESPSQRIVAAWWWAGANWHNDMPIITRTQLLTFLTTQRNLSEGAAKNALKPSFKKGIVSQLTSESFISIDGGCVTITDSATISKLRIKTSQNV